MRKDPGTIIVYAHPDTGREGYCSNILKEAVSRLRREGIGYSLIDLYKIKYDPVLHEDELYSAGYRNVSAQNLRFQKMIEKANCLIFIYPVWWNGAPAMLKGFFDRVFVSGFAFRYENGIPKGLLKGKKALVLQTSGASEILSRIFEGNRSAKVTGKDTLGFCGIKSRVLHIGKAVRLNDSQIKEIKEKVDRGLGWLYR